MATSRQRKTRAPRASRASIAHRATAWQCGVAQLPGYVGGEGEPFRPVGIFWMNEDGMLIGTQVAHPDSLEDQIIISLEQVMARPLAGVPQRPSRIRVKSPGIAALLQANTVGIDIVCGPTPEVDEALRAMTEAFAADADQLTDSYLSGGADPEQVASLFDAAAGFYRAQPWRVIPDDQSLFEVTITELGIRNWIISTIGQMGQNFGLAVFQSIDYFDRFVHAATDIEGDSEPDVPAYLSINFESRGDMPPALLEEITRHRWPVADARGYPWILCIEEDALTRPVAPRDIQIAESLLRAIPPALQDRKALLAAWQRGTPWERTQTIAIFDSPVTVSLRARV